MQINGLVAAVTGGGSGLGEATARALAANGAKVACLDVNMKGAEAVAADIGGAAIRCDVSSAESGVAAMAEIREKLGDWPRILVNCAGIGTVGKTVGKEGALNLEVFQRTVNVNLVGSFNMIRLMAEKCQDMEPLDGGERGVIINTASVAAFDGQIGQVSYSASKGGVVGMTLPIARDLARSGIRVMTIAPGLFKTPMMAGLPEDAQASLGQQVPFPPRLGDPAEYAALAVHIVGNQMLNGETIRLDGAIRMAPR
ncbi:MAG: 3-hydroxyacyl-CoA dehydrogenase [Zhengella sp.]|uniref:3-hydroxyacyl-CoA dehydrogenase n=1 Tax=Zhengella sp. TaxID=2282762 RepID=UPI001D22909D|nr:3-hydroxyacyl-CoA dehydrogenase [Notoacmeibacter sp.]MCC0027587.1 3-hydroxyacyl-CoA dehydrogenase [Brucellaceae bacterium]